MERLRGMLDRMGRQNIIFRREEIKCRRESSQGDIGETFPYLKQVM